MFYQSRVSTVLRTPEDGAPVREDLWPTQRTHTQPALYHLLYQTYLIADIIKSKQRDNRCGHSCDILNEKKQKLRI